MSGFIVSDLVIDLLEILCVQLEMCTHKNKLTHPNCIFFVLHRYAGSLKVKNMNWQGILEHI